MTTKSEATLPLEHEPIKTSVEMVNVTPAEMTTTEGPDINRLMEIALQQGEGGVGALEKLVALQERMEDRAAKKAFSAAMLSFQNACPVIAKNSQGHQHKYTSYDYAVSTIKPHAEKNGLSWSFKNDTTAPEGFVRKICTVRHVLGHSEDYVGPLFPQTPASTSMGPQQSVGSAESYAMRYTLLPALGVATGEDNDGAPKATTFLTDEQVANLDALIDETKADRKAFLKFAKVDQIAHIPQSQYRKLVHMLRAKS